MTSSVFPDVNLWLALSSPDHVQAPVAWTWYTTLPSGTSILFCRHTQMGLLRLLTTQAAMNQLALNQLEAWQVYDRWINSEGIYLSPEPHAMEVGFRARTQSHHCSPKEWADAYLAAFAEAAGLTLVTFDRALAGKAKGAVLLS